MSLSMCIFLAYRCEDFHENTRGIYRAVPSLRSQTNDAFVRFLNLAETQTHFCSVLLRTPQVVCFSSIIRRVAQSG